MFLPNVRPKIHSRPNFFAFEGKSFFDGDATGRHECGFGYHRDAHRLGGRGRLQEPDSRQGDWLRGADSRAGFGYERVGRRNTIRVGFVVNQSVEFY